MAHEHQIVVLGCIEAARVLRGHDLKAALDAIERADSIGAILDPTLYRDKHQAMMDDKALLEAALPLWRFAEKLAENR